MRVWIYSGGRPSNSAKALAQQPGFKRMLTGKGLKAGDVVVNWGATKGGWGGPEPVLNQSEAVARASNKYHTFSALAGCDVSTVPWTANEAVAKEWKAEGSVVVARKVLTGHSGAGIIIVEKEDELVAAPLYTKYIFKVREFRVHATQTEVIDTQQKIRDPKQEPKSWKVRSHQNGFIFARDCVKPSEARDLLATKTIKALGLDFGAVDIVEDKKGVFYVLEVNTAPGLEGQTIEAYTKILTGLADVKNKND